MPIALMEEDPAYFKTWILRDNAMDSKAPNQWFDHLPVLAEYLGQSPHSSSIESLLEGFKQDQHLSKMRGCLRHPGLRGKLAILSSIPWFQEEQRVIAFSKMGKDGMHPVRFMLGLGSNC